MPMTIDEFSLTTIPIFLRFNQTPISTATAFTWQRDNKHYLITNWHVVSGRNPNTGEHLSPMAAEPNILCGLINTRGAENVCGKHAFSIRLRHDPDEVAWLIHPRDKRKIDVVAIPLSEDLVSSAYLYSMNEMGSLDLRVNIGMDVFVLGYPFDVDEDGLPVWKRGSIASEPDLVPHVKNYLLVDTASRPGMSGSPVILRSWGAHMTEDGGATFSTGQANKFIGIYSGRLHTKDPMDAQIGMAWSPSFIDEIIDGGLRECG
jgi:hypothetical protein